MYLLWGPFIGIFLGGVAAAFASGGLAREVPAGAWPGPGDDGTRATAQATHEVTVNACRAWFFSIRVDRRLARLCWIQTSIRQER